VQQRTAASVIGGRYRIDGLLGEGGMARVFDGFDERLGRPVAVKILRGETLALPGMRSRFQQEARIAARLVHPNIVAVLDFGEDETASYLVMERLPGTTLRDEIIRGGLSRQRLAKVVNETLTALAAAHRCGVLHRDVKPSNILLEEEGHAKLTDFGIAKSFDDRAGSDACSDLTLTGVVLGTPGYLAPERRSGLPATVQSDLYAVGAVMVEAATGRRLAPDGPGPEVLVSPFREVARRALTAEPRARYASADEMREALRPSPTGPARPTAPARPVASTAPTVPMTAPAARPQTPAGTAHLPRPPAGGVSSGRRRGNRRRVAFLAVVVLAMLAALFVVLAKGSQPTGPAATAAGRHVLRTIGKQTTTTTTTTTATTTTTTTQDPEATAITSLASSLVADGLPGDAALAAALEGTAGQPAGPSRQAAAAQTLALAQVLLDEGGISHAQEREVVAILQPAGATPGTAPDSIPAPNLPGGLFGGHGHDHGAGQGDQG
jgi:eukaryotic-like serine/threonine-protein kinase